MPTILLYVAFTVNVPGLTLPLLGENDSPVPAPVPETKLVVKFDVWSVPDESTTVQVVPLDGLVISVEPFASAWKNTAVDPMVTVWLLGVTVTEVTP